MSKVQDLDGYTLEQKADFTLAEWMHVTGYSQEEVRALPDDLCEAIYADAWEWGCEFRNTNNEGEDNPFDEYLDLMKTEMKRRGTWPGSEASI